MAKKKTRRSSGKVWNDEQREFAWRLRHPLDGSKPVPFLEIPEKLYDAFNVRRQPTAIQQVISCISRGLKKVSFELHPGQSENGSVYETLMAYDSQHVDPVLKKRTDYLYELMDSQAEKLKNFDAYSRFSKMDVGEIIRSGSAADKRGVASLLESEITSPELSQIEMIAIPGNGECRSHVGILLPIYVGDVRKGSDKGVRSAFHDVTIATLGARGTGLKKRTPFRARLKDLLIYQFETTRHPNYRELSERITEGLSQEFDGVNVAIHEDKHLATGYKSEVD